MQQFSASDRHPNMAEVCQEHAHLDFHYACVHLLLIRTPETKEILDGWNLEFDDMLLRYKGRVLPAETIYQQSTSVSCDDPIG